MFENRTEAGRRLAARLDERDVRVDVVLAVPRDGLPIGRAVADGLDARLDVVAARALAPPGSREPAIGAVAGDGTVWLDERLLADLDVGEGVVAERIERERRVAAGKAAWYRGDRPPPDLRGADVVVVDDGSATCGAVLACVGQSVNAGARRVVVGTPVAPPGAAERLREAADDVVCVETPTHFAAVELCYESDERLSDERARAYLVEE